MKMIMLLLLALPFAGCRHAGPRVTITDSPGAVVYLGASKIEARQGKVVEIPTEIGRAAKLTAVP